MIHEMSTLLNINDFEADYAMAIVMAAAYNVSPAYPRHSNRHRKCGQGPDRADKLYAMLHD